MKEMGAMFEIRKNAWAFLLWSTLAGTISFFIAGVIGCIILLRLDNYILETIIAGGLGGLLLGICLGKAKMIGKMALAPCCNTGWFLEFLHFVGSTVFNSI